MSDREAVIKAALIEGIKQARTEIDLLRMNDNAVDAKSINIQVEVYDDLIVEMADALHWLGGDEFAEMQALYREVKAQTGKEV